MTRSPDLYDPALEHDGCGVAAVARVDGRPTHEVLERAIGALVALEHRGASSADGTSGDGAGVLVQLPDDFFRSRAPEIQGLNGELPVAGAYAVGQAFLPRDPERRARAQDRIERTVRGAGQQVLGWRDVPVDPEHCGTVATCPWTLRPPAAARATSCRRSASCSWLPARRSPMATRSSAPST